jgi:hypothetical protein
MKILILIMAQLLVVSMLAVTMSAATVDGIQIHSSTNRKGPQSVILGHGWTCDETTWKSQNYIAKGRLQFFAYVKIIGIREGF